jgi:hypothetical protein
MALTEQAAAQLLPKCYGWLIAVGYWSKVRTLCGDVDEMARLRKASPSCSSQCELRLSDDVIACPALGVEPIIESSAHLLVSDAVLRTLQLRRVRMLAATAPNARQHRSTNLRTEPDCASETRAPFAVLRAASLVKEKLVSSGVHPLEPIELRTKQTEPRR